MKRTNLILSITMIMVMVLFSACQKDQTSDPNVVLNPVKAVAGSYIAKDGDITLKSAFVVTTRTWSMYARNSVHYGNVPFALVDGSEFILGSPANLWWAAAGNNPVTFNANQSVYSNLTPDENLRVIEEGIVGTDLVYLGMLDFNPDAASFPLTVNGYRLGDKLTINTGNLTTIPGGSGIALKVAYKTKPINLPATKTAVITGNHAVPNSKQFVWENIVYGAESAVISVPLVGTADNVVYDSFTGKVSGDIVISLSFNGGAFIDLTPIPAVGDGKCLLIKLKTTKVGWYDSATITINDFDIEQVVENITIN